jgi:hypothetical protein
VGGFFNLGKLFGYGRMRYRNRKGVLMHILTPDSEIVFGEKLFAKNRFPLAIRYPLGTRVKTVVSGGQIPDCVDLVFMQKNGEEITLMMLHRHSLTADHLEIFANTDPRVQVVSANGILVTFPVNAVVRHTLTIRVNHEGTITVYADLKPTNFGSELE